MAKQNEKSVFKSKTLWANLILAIIAFIPSVRVVVTEEVLLQVMVGLNIFLRVVTKDKVVLFEK